MSEPQVPHALRSAAALSWRLLVVAAAVAAVVYALVQIRLVVLPLIVALFVTAVLSPPAEWLRRRRWPAALAAGAVMAGAGLVLFGVLALIAPAVADQLGELDLSLSAGIDRLADLIADSPLALSREEVEASFNGVLEEIRRNTGVITRGLVSGAILAAEVVTGLLLTLVLVFFLLKDGALIWRWVLGLFGAGTRPHVAVIGARIWDTLGGYLRGIAVVGVVDSLLIGLALVLIGVPLVLPLMVLTFFAAFFPIVGAVVAGFVAAVVALVSGGVVDALLVVAAVTAVQQVEGDVLYPFVVGRALRLHPVAILLGLTAGAVLGGVVGAFLAVPVVASANVALRHARDPAPGAGPEPATAPEEEPAPV